MKAVAWITSIKRGDYPPDKIISVKLGDGIIPLALTYKQAAHFMDKEVLEALTQEPQEVSLRIKWPVTQNF